MIACSVLVVVGCSGDARKLRRKRIRDTSKPPRSKDAHAKQRPKKLDARVHHEVKTIANDTLDLINNCYHAGPVGRACGEGRC
jgi:hypothetical protein